MIEQFSTNLQVFINNGTEKTKKDILAAIDKLRPQVDEEIKDKRYTIGEAKEVTYDVRFKETSPGELRINIFAKIAYNTNPDIIIGG